MFFDSVYKMMLSNVICNGAPIQEDSLVVVYINYPKQQSPWMQFCTQSLIMSLVLVVACLSWL